MVEAKAPSSFFNQDVPELGQRLIGTSEMASLVQPGRNLDSGRDKIIDRFLALIILHLIYGVLPVLEELRVFLRFKRIRFWSRSRLPFRIMFARRGLLRAKNQKNVNKAENPRFTYAGKRRFHLIRFL